ncbi:MAG: YitT family protein [Solibacillus sp.]
MKKKYRWQWIFYVVGITVMSLGITLTIKGEVFGVSPWDVLHIGLYQNFGLTIGQWGILTGLMIVVSTSLYMKRLPRIATWINMISIGLLIDLFNWLLPNATVFAAELAYFIVGFFVLSIGCGLYISANLGAGPRDTVMMIITERFGGTVRRARMIMEVFAVTLGWLLGGPVGIGTIVLALGTGYIIQPSLYYFQKQLAHITKDENVL